MDLELAPADLKFRDEVRAFLKDAVTPDMKRAQALTTGFASDPEISIQFHRAQLNPSGRIRKHFDLYANLRPSRAVPGVVALSAEIDVLVVRENTEGMYSDRNMAVGSGEFKPSPDVALTVGVFTRPAIERVIRAAAYRPFEGGGLGGHG